MDWVEVGLLWKAPRTPAMLAGVASLIRMAKFQPEEMVTLEATQSCLITVGIKPQVHCLTLVFVLALQNHHVLSLECLTCRLMA